LRRTTQRSGSYVRSLSAKKGDVSIASPGLARMAGRTGQNEICSCPGFSCRGAVNSKARCIRSNPHGGGLTTNLTLNRSAIGDARSLSLRPSRRSDPGADARSKP
jgi:hypothetical protein